MSTSAFLILLIKKVRVDNNENYAKIPMISKPISEDFNLKLKLWYNFTFLILWISLVLWIFFSGKLAVVIKRFQNIESLNSFYYKNSLLESLRFFSQLLFVLTLKRWRIKNKIGLYEQARPYEWRHEDQKFPLNWILHHQVTINKNEFTFKKYSILMQIQTKLELTWNYNKNGL